MEYISVAVEGMGRRYPVKTVKIVADLPDGSALVVVRFPSYSIAGEISIEAKAQLLGHRLLTGDKVVIAEKDNALINWPNEPQPGCNRKGARCQFTSEGEDGSVTPRSTAGECSRF
jgi:hypothetical protein